MNRNDLCLMMLQQSGICRPEELAQRYRETGQDAFALLLKLKDEFADRKGQLGRTWADLLRVAYVDIDTTVIDPAVVRRIPQAFARKHTLVPLYEVDGVVTVAAAEPDSPLLFDEANGVLGLNLETVFSFPDEIRESIDLVYQSEEELIRQLSQTGIIDLDNQAQPVTAEQLLSAAGSDAIIQFTRGLFILALVQRASDIHIEPKQHTVRIRFRIDGVLQDRFNLEKALLPSVATRLKALANLDIVETRRPQDGRFRFELARRHIDIRFSSVPALHGEKLVLRLLGQLQSKGAPELDQLDFSAALRLGLEAVCKSPNGIFLVTGPTGSGKTTSLYAILNRLSSPEVNIMTVEDPVEYQLEAANQVQVNAAVNLDFAAALRAFLRQDPDVILIGEIRDLETAKIATQAALTGHLVLATMHTNSAIQAVTRLLEIGVEPYFVAPAMLGVLSQRLVRRICEHCKQKYSASTQVVEDNFTLKAPQELSLYLGRGCDRCHFSGYAGRVAIHEFLPVDSTLRTMIAHSAPVAEMEAHVRQAGCKSLRYDGMKKVLRGMTTLAELDQATFAELA